MKNFKNKYISVFGLGTTGIAVARKLVSLGAKVFVSEVKPEAAFSKGLLSELKKIKIDMEFGGHTSQAIASAGLIVVSPGIHIDFSLFEEARSKGIPIISEIELAYQILHKPIIAVTGTNGKTTTTTLIEEMLKAAGKKVAVAGNIGYPLISVDDNKLDFIVAEISSYQLEFVSEFRPWISVFLNIQEDHLERHHSMQEYMVQKARIFTNQNEKDYLVYNADDKFVSSLVNSAKATKIGFSKNKTEVLGMSPVEIRIPGKHNLENALAAAQAVSLCGVNSKTIAAVLNSFPGVEHRIEFVGEKKGIKFYNDSKATNPSSTLAALETFAGQQIILILGGRDKGVDLEAIGEKIKKEVKGVVLLGEATQRFKEKLNKIGFSNIHLAKSMKEAVELSFNLGKPGDIVLLSPACASFDIFHNFEERGRVFKECVNKK